MIEETEIVIDHSMIEETVVTNHSMEEEIVATLEKTETMMTLETEITTLEGTEIMMSEGTEIMMSEGTEILSMGEIEIGSETGISTEIGAATAVSLHGCLENRENILHLLASETASQAAYLDLSEQLVVAETRIKRKRSPYHQ